MTKEGRSKIVVFHEKKPFNLFLLHQGKELCQVKSVERQEGQVRVRDLLCLGRRIWKSLTFDIHFFFQMFSVKHVLPSNIKKKHDKPFASCLATYPQLE